MVEYGYENLFENHGRVDFLIVRHGASLVWNSETGKFDITGSDYCITNSELANESINLDEKLCSQDNLRFGLCEAAYLEFVIYNRTTIPNLKDETIDVHLYFDSDPATLFQVGVYVVDEDTYTAGRQQRNISAYDWNHQLLDLDITEWYNYYFDNTSATFRQIFFVLADLFKWIRGDDPYDDDDAVSKASPQLPIEISTNFVLVNGDFVVNKTIESDTITFGFFMQGMLELNGCFGHIDREGKFRFVRLEYYQSEPVRTITDANRIPPTNYNDKATWGIGQIDVYDRNNVRKFRVRNTSKKYPSTYVMVDPWILADRKRGDSDVQQALTKLQTAIYYYNYTPSETECLGDLCVEVGDRVDVQFQPTEGDTRNSFRTYVLERRFRGIQGFRDTYTANGDLKQPKYKIKNDKWHNGDSNSSTQGSGGVSVLDAESDFLFIKKLRNIGIRLLDEPSNVVVEYNKETATVDISWTDPDDITDYQPHPCEWVGTVIIRKEGEPPVHRWDGERILLSNTRDAYAETPYSDENIEANKKYYYGIFPYYIALDDADHPIRHYTWTKVISVDTERILVAPTITTAQADGTSVTALYLIPALEVGTYASIKLAAKKGGIPTSLADADKAIDIPEPSGLIPIGTATMGGLDELSTYYFVIFVEDELGNTAYSDAVECLTGEVFGKWEETISYLKMITG